MNNGPEWMDDERTEAAAAAKQETAGPETAHSGADAVPYLLRERDTAAEEPETGSLEHDLCAALQPVDLPSGFAERVLARAAAEDAPRTLIPAQAPDQTQRRGVLLHWPAQRRWLSGAAAAVIVACLVGGGAVHERQVEHEHKVAQANAQFATAERITDQALAETRQQLVEAGVKLDQ